MANATSSSGAQSAVKSPQQRRRSKRPAGVPIAMIAVIVVKTHVQPNVVVNVKATAHHNRWIYIVSKWGVRMV